MTKFLKLTSLRAITVYQIFISPLLVQVLGTHCRYEISCSNFAKLAIKKNGLLKGSLFSLRRLISCQPFVSSFKIEELKIQ